MELPLAATMSRARYLMIAQEEETLVRPMYPFGYCHILALLSCALFAFAVLAQTHSEGTQAVQQQAVCRDSALKRK